MNKFFTIVIANIICLFSFGQSFTELDSIYTPGQSVIPADFDNDGDIDVFIYNDGEKYYENNNGVYTAVNSLPGALGGLGSASSVDIADFDADGDLDILYSGAINGSPSQKKCYILKYGSGNFTLINISSSVPGSLYGTTKWVDYDNDNDLDIITCGELSSSTWMSRIYKNNSGTYNLISSYLSPLQNCRFEIFDCDKDGDKDLIMFGYRASIGAGRVILYKNNNYLYQPTDSTSFGGNLLPGDIKTGDMNNDGYDDVVISGSTSFINETRIYKNNSGLSFSLLGTITQSTNDLKLWDYNNDGYTDILLSMPLRIYNGAGTGTFALVTSGISSTVSEAALADINEDNKVDLLVFRNTGGTWNDQRLLIYKNLSSASSVSPTAPSGLSASTSANGTLITWNAGNDDHTPINSLTYNIIIGTSSGGSSVFPSTSTPGAGLRYHSTGNTWRNKKYNSFLAPGTYYASVQTIDNHYLGSTFSTAYSFTVPFIIGSPTLISPSNNSLNLPITNNFSWSTVGGATSYHFQISSDANFTDIVAEDSTLATTNSAFTVPDCQTSYYWRVRAIAVGGVSSWSTVYKLTTKNAFTQSAIVDSIPGWKVIKLKWVDFDNDSDNDIAAVWFYNNIVYLKLYSNNSGVFTYHSTIDSLYSIAEAEMEWADYDMDGYQDVIWDRKILRNNHPGFSPLLPVLPMATNGEVKWMDVDNDNDPDYVSVQPDSSRINLNDGIGNFILHPFDFFTTGTGSRLAIGDIDFDGDMDIIHSRQLGSFLYINSGGNFTSINNPFPYVYYGCIDLYDLESDNDLDLLINGVGVASTYATRLYTNSSNAYTLYSNYSAVNNGVCKFIDFNRDGEMDFYSAGRTGYCGFYKNTAGVFNQFLAAPAQVNPGYYCTEFADYDHDGDEDAVLTIGNDAIKLFNNNEGNNIYSALIIPTAPSALSTSTTNNSVDLSWSMGRSPINTALTYNIRVGTTPGGSEIRSPLANASTGQLFLQQKGNTNDKNTVQLKNLAPGTYYWSVQTVSPSLVGSPFAVEQSFTIGSVNIENVQTRDIKVFPNPFTDKIYIQAPLKGNIIVTNIMGQEIYTQKLNEQEVIDLTFLQKGIYNLTFMNDQIKTTFKLIKQ
ncbi:MAG: tandem-95 repeat protein [Bacteroidetes bacterium]|jgi:hypothetical protein|nr:tandem-95 repeat protein [Bacteroidota bacterium]